MKNALAFLLLGAGALGGCQQSATPTDQPAAPAAAATPPAAAVTDQAGARAAVGRYLQTLPDARVYVLDSANVVDVDSHYQVLVPRTDWAGRMPNRARFQVDKATGVVQDLPVK